MTEHHWFDVLNRSLVRSTPRRELVRAAAALAVGWLVGRAPAAGVGAASVHCARRQCRDAFDTRKDRNFCAIKCGRCRIRSKFCIVGGTPSNPVKQATCCHEDQECCGTECCGPSGHCCDLHERGKHCISPNAECCEDDPVRGFCSPAQVCCPGVGYVTCPNFADPVLLACCGSVCYNAVGSMCCMPDHPCPRSDVNPDWVCCPPPAGCCRRGTAGCCE